MASPRPSIMAVYHKYRAGYFVSISDADRAPGLNYLATVYNGIDLALYPQRKTRGEELVFIGRHSSGQRIPPGHRVRAAKRAATADRRHLQDPNYFRAIFSRILMQQICYVGAGWM